MVFISDPSIIRGLLRYSLAMNFSAACLYMYSIARLIFVVHQLFENRFRLARNNVCPFLFVQIM
ncbi:MAG TPA: hypothetical protein DHV29_08145 [Bacteroidales bacterium]|nr:MAG: hypothetical protein A2W94_00875 [Bacteroidetes bacterium GWE2_42_42]HCY23447.1 hypothetical protein [Bacteroidales bacterium]